MLKVRAAAVRLPVLHGLRSTVVELNGIAHGRGRSPITDPKYTLPDRYRHRVDLLPQCSLDRRRSVDWYSSYV